MGNTILCIFEGEKREHNYFSSIEKSFFSTEAIIKCSYGNDLYHLLNELESDPDLDIVELIRESKSVPKNEQLLSGIDRDAIAQVFLFFDMEPHDDLYSDTKLKKLIHTFNEETEFGKLYVSYPMIEAIRDMPSLDEFLELKVDLDQCTGQVYKSLSENRRQLIPQDFRKINSALWKDITNISIKKSQFISNSLIPPSQLKIFEAQTYCLNSTKSIYVLSAFPFFLYEYFGSSFLQK